MDIGWVLFLRVYEDLWKTTWASTQLSSSEERSFCTASSTSSWTNNNMLELLLPGSSSTSSSFAAAAVTNARNCVSVLSTTGWTLRVAIFAFVFVPQCWIFYRLIWCNLHQFADFTFHSASIIIPPIVILQELVCTDYADFADDAAASEIFPARLTKLNLGGVSPNCSLNFREIRSTMICVFRAVWPSCAICRRSSTLHHLQFYHGFFAEQQLDQVGSFPTSLMRILNYPTISISG